MGMARTSDEMLRLEDAVTYPGSARKAFWSAVAGMAVVLVGALAAPGTPVLIWPFVGVAVMTGALALTIRRTNRVLARARRIFQDHPEYSPQQAADAARREPGFAEVRRP